MARKYEEDYDEEEYDEEDYEEYDDEYDDDEEYDEEDYYEDRAAFRHSRRIKNQIIVWIVTVILLALVVIGVIFGINTIIDRISASKAATEQMLQEQAEENKDGEPVAVEAPSAE